jgi:arginine N-succinyltransferase
VFYIRSAERADLPALLQAARHLDSVNLPNDEARLSEAIDRSEKSFAGKLEPPRREYLFVMVDRVGNTEQVIGSSMIFAQHGSRRFPHAFFDVLEEERYSETLDRHFRHKVLRIGYNYSGPTEIGGLVLLPAYRGHREQLGKTLVNVRFLYLALHRQAFRDEIVSELMPPLEADGTSLLWEALGRHFTGLSYQQADRLSRENKEFIRALFPQDPIYATLLPAGAQERIGQVGPETKAVERMLVRAGFKYANRIDPFDGGPHFHARTDELIPVKSSRRLMLAETWASPPDPAGTVVAIVAADLGGAPRSPFRAVRAPAQIVGEKVVLLEETARFLGVDLEDPVGVLPL